MTFRSRLILVIVLLSSALIAALVGLVWAVQRTSFHIERSHLAHEGYDAALVLSERLGDYGREVIAIQLGAASGPEKRRTIEARCEEAFQEIQAHNMGEQAHLGSEPDGDDGEAEEGDDLKSIHDAFIALKADVRAAEAVRHESDAPRAKELSAKALATLDADVRGPLAAYRADELLEVQAAQRSAESYVHLSRWLSVGMGVGAALGAVTALVAILLLRTLASRIEALAAATRELARGNMAFRISTYGNDELGRLASEFNGMAAQISELHQELDERARRIEQAYAFQKDFFAMMTHELRAPLSSILGFCELLFEDEVQLGEQAAHNIRWIESSARRMLEQVNSILLLARLEAGRTEVTVKPFALRPVLGSVMQGLRAHIKALGRDIDAELSVAEDVPTELFSDEEKVIHILTNLVDNAAKFTESGRIEIRAEGTADGGVSVMVSDTGIGIPEDSLQSIFDIYTAGTRHGSGSGIGLAVAQRFARLLGGTLGVTSKVGDGSKFTLVIGPLGDPSQATGKA